MQSFSESIRKHAVGAVCTIIFSGAGLLNSAHATFPGENGLILISDYATLEITAVSNGGTPKVLAVNALGGAVSPNGKQIAYVDKASGDVFIRNIDGTGAAFNVTRSEQKGFLSAPVWSPDGKKLAYLGIFSPRLGINTINTDGTGDKNLGWFGGAGWLSWSPRGDRIAFNSSSGQDLQTINSDGTGSAFVFPRGFLEGRDYPSWAPDGRSLIFSGLSNGQWIPYEIGASGSSFRSILTGNTDFTGGVISPDGSLIVGRARPSATLGLLPRSGGAVTPVPGNINAGHLLDWGRVPRTAMVVSQVLNNWQPAAPLAGDGDFYAAESAIAVMPDNGGIGGTLKQVVAIGPDGRVYHRALKIGSTIWTPFAPVPGVGGSAQGIMAKKVAIAGALDGSAQIAIVGDDDLLYHAIRFPNGNWGNSTWNGFGRLDGYGGGPGTTFAARDVAIAVAGSSFTSPGSAHVVANGLTVGGLYHRIRSADGSWAPFGKVPGSDGLDTQELAIAIADNGDAYTLATVRSPSVWTVLKQVRRSNGNWDDPWNVNSFPANVRDVALAVTATKASQLPVLQRTCLRT